MPSPGTARRTLARPKPAAPISFASKRPPETIGSIRVVLGAYLCWEDWSRVPRRHCRYPREDEGRGELWTGRRGDRVGRPGPGCRRGIGGAFRDVRGAQHQRLHHVGQLHRHGRQSRRRLRLHRASRTTSGPGIISGRPALPAAQITQFSTAPTVLGRRVNQADLFCAAATSTDYALLSPCVCCYSYGAPQRRVCDESFACYLLWEPSWRYAAIVAFVERVTRSTATVRNPGESGGMRLLPAGISEPPIGIEPMTYALRGCSGALLPGSKPVRASCSQVAAGGDRWLLMAVRGHLGDTRQ